MPIVVFQIIFLEIIFPYADDTDFNREQSDFSVPFFYLLYSASSLCFRMYFLFWWQTGIWSRRHNLFRSTWPFLLIRAVLGTLEFQEISCLFFSLSGFVFLVKASHLKWQLLLKLVTWRFWPSYWSDAKKGKEKHSAQPFGIFQLWTKAV